MQDQANAYFKCKNAPILILLFLTTVIVIIITIMHYYVENENWDWPYSPRCEVLTFMRNSYTSKGFATPDANFLKLIIKKLESIALQKTLKKQYFILY